MEIITVTKENLATEHICCAISNNDDCQVKLFYDGQFITHEILSVSKFEKIIDQKCGV